MDKFGVDDRDFIANELSKYAETNIDNNPFVFEKIRKEVSNNYTMPKFIEDYKSYNIPSGSSNFLKLEDGENKIRICTKALEVAYHEQKEGAKYSTTICTGNECELCKLGKPRKYKYAFLVLNRKDGKPYIYEAPITVFRQIVAYDTNEEYGDVRKYDLTIRKEGVARNTTYTIIASPKKSELTDEEIKMIAESGVSLEAAYGLNHEDEV